MIEGQDERDHPARHAEEIAEALKRAVTALTPASAVGTSMALVLTAAQMRAVDRAAIDRLGRARPGADGERRAGRGRG